MWFYRNRDLKIRVCGKDSIPLKILLLKFDLALQGQKLIKNINYITKKRVFLESVIRHVDRPIKLMINKSKLSCYKLYDFISSKLSNQKLYIYPICL